MELNDTYYFTLKKIVQSPLILIKESMRCYFMNKRIFLICIFFAMILLLSGCETGPGHLSGRVVNGITGEPIEGIWVSYIIPVEATEFSSFEKYVYPREVTADNRSELMRKYVEEKMASMPDRTIGTTTDADGIFYIDNVIYGYTITLRFRKVYYNEKIIDLSVRANEEIDLGVVKVFLDEQMVDIAISVFDEEEQIVENAVVLLTKTDEYYPNIPTVEIEKDIEIENVSTNERVFFDKAVEAITYYSGTAYVRIEPGTYKIEVSKFGYETELVENVLVDSDYRITITLRR